MKQLTIGISVFALMTIILSCNSTNDSTSNVTVELDSNESIAKAFDLMSTKCFACHGSDADMQNRLAPPMIAVKQHYIDSETTLKSFTKDMVSFVQNPNEDNAKMFGAVRKFGLMPKMDFRTEDIEVIAKYIFENEIEEPEWFQKHLEEGDGNSKGMGKNNLSTKEKGLNLALSTKKVLGKNLMAAINKNGSEYAVDFCNIKAIHLIDSMSNELNARIKRVSDKPRNPNAQANKQELKIISEFKTALAAGSALAPQLVETTNKDIGYYPITTNQMCIQCHGAVKKDIEDNTLAKINKLYPQDQATGYDINQLRGIWVVEMQK